MPRDSRELTLVAEGETWPLAGDHSHARPDTLSELDAGSIAAAINDFIGSLGQRTAASYPAPGKNITIGNFRSRTYVLAEPLHVFLEENEEGEVVARSYDTGQYGHGICEEDAIDHLCSVLEGYFELLLEDRGRLGAQPKKHFDYLERVLRKT